MLILVCLLGCAPAAAQTSETPQAPPPGSPAGVTGVDVEALPISIERIGERLEQPPALDLGALRPTFRVQIVARRPRWSTNFDWLGTADGGRAPAGTPWHDEFLNMVTPPQARPYGAFEGWDLLQVMGTSLVQGLAVGAVGDKIKSTLRERREREAREEVDAAIAAWKQEREAEAAKASRTGTPEP